MKQVATAVFMLVYGAFAPVCFASTVGEAVDTPLTHDMTAMVMTGEHMSHVMPAEYCLGDTCVNEKLTTVSGHSAMYGEMTGVELGSTLMLLLGTIGICLAVLFRQGLLVVDSAALVLFSWPLRVVDWYLRQLLLAWMSRYTRSPSFVPVLA